MAFNIPTVASLAERARQAFRREMPGTDALVWPNVLSVHARVLALVLRPVYERLDWMWRQSFARTADREHLVGRHGWDYGLAPAGASRATGEVTATGVPSTVYPAGIRLLSGSDLYLTTAAATAAGDGDVVLAVRADVPGAGGNRIAGEVLRLADPGLYPGLGPEVEVGEDGLGGGAEVEDTESFRARILDRKRRPPKGGAYSDYEQWAREVTGVANAWAAPAAYGPGTVVVFFTFEGRANFVPTDGDVSVVDAALEARRRIAVEVVAAKPIPVAVNITLSVVPDTAEVRAAASAALAAVMQPERPNGTGGRMRPGRPLVPFVLSKSWLSEAVSLAVGEDRSRITLPADDVAFVDGRMPVLGNVQFQ